jgi:uncharacterized protein YndB with AHSA1/START domain
MIKNTVYIPASRERVFSALTAFPRYPEWVPNCEQCTVLSSSGTTTTVEMLINVTRRIRMSVRFEGEPEQMLQFEMISGKDLKKYSGLYRLVTAVDGAGTVLFTDLDIEVASMPRFLTDSAAKKSLDKGALSLKKFVEKLVRAEDTASIAAPVAAEPRTPLRARRLLQIVKQTKCYRVWFMGEAFTMKKIEGNVSISERRPEWSDR